MKLAVCFFGQPRYFEQWLDFNKELYDGCEVDYYCHFWGDDKIKNEIEKTFNPQKIIVDLR